MKKTVLGILLLCTLLLIRPATALASGPCCNFCGRDVTFVKLKPYPRYHELIYWCDACKMNTRLDVSHTGGTATCTERAVCEVCNQPYGEPPAHTGGTEFPTCTTGRTCKKCGAEYGILGHMWTTRMSLGNGTHRRSCMRCGAVDTANCTGGTRTCFQRSVCIYCRSEYGDLYPHQLKTFKRPATCRQEGLEYTRCTAEGCNYRTPDIITPKQHNLKKAREFTREPTCTKPGWKSYYLCTTCTTYSETDWVEKLGHDPILHEAKAPTCTEKGWDAYETCSRCNYNTCAELPALNHDYQAVTVDPTCEADGYTVFTCSRCKDSYTADPTDKLGHQFGAWSPNGTGSQSADCLRQGCAHTGSTDCRKFTFRTAEGETLIFCPVCGQAENAAQLEKLEAATAWAVSGCLSAEDVTARTNGEYLSVAFETAGSLTQPTGRVRLALPAGLLEGKKLVRIAPDGTQTELPFEAKNGRLIFTLDFANSELPVMLFRLVPQTTVL